MRINDLIFNSILDVCQGDTRAGAHPVKYPVLILEEPGWRVKLDYLSSVNHADSVVSNDGL